MERAVVFPGQGSGGGEVSGEVLEAVRARIGDSELPYQLSVFAASVDLLYRLRNADIGADVVAGHSLGEYAAAHACGSLGLEDGVGLVVERGRLMEEAALEHPGVMVALIGADPDRAARAAEETEGTVVAANFNTPRQTVISGTADAVQAASERAGGRSVPLGVAGAFHSPLMAEASRGMTGMLKEVELREPVVPMVGASDGTVLGTAEEVRAALQHQMLSPVRWVSVMERLFELGVGEIVEAGRDGTLTRMLRDYRRKDVFGKKAEELLA